MTDPRNAGPEVELLSFRLGEQEYSLDIMSVREIRGWTRATPLPHAPSYMRGVINLRGTVLPVLDLSARLGMEPVRGDGRNVVIVVQSGAQSTGQSVGLLVDAVSDILAIPRSAMQPPPPMSESGGGFVEALTISEGRMIRILNLSAVLPDDHSEAA